MNRRRIPEQVRERVWRQATGRCGYCLSPQEYVWGKLEVEHIIPLATGGIDAEENLWLACRPCNLYKGAQTEAEDPATGQRVSLFNPRTQSWRDHFTWSSDGTQIKGLTATGRATVIALRLNDSRRVAIRRLWVEVGWHPPKM
ncbi:MAG: HNH endonuclease [candidate division KSB1 bacterium]|nr:HNH endonuclease [candidate division KSB1 bacterium]MDZ7303067.1 HNH endonuclease [candidate division KSB1 bacterium]MDZ7314395.1 HNH endonuclease [candidate division KSB1 bacterium]